MMMSSVTGHSSLRLIGLYRIVSSCVPVGCHGCQSTFGTACRRDRAVSGSSPHGRGAGGPGGMRLRRSSLSFDQEPTCTVQRTLRVTALPPTLLRGPRARAARPRRGSRRCTATRYLVARVLPMVRYRCCRCKFLSCTESTSRRRHQVRLCTCDSVWRVTHLSHAPLLLLARPLAPDGGVRLSC